MPEIEARIAQLQKEREELQREIAEAEARVPQKKGSDGGADWV